MLDTVIFDLGGVLIDWNPRFVYRQIFQTEAEIDHFFEKICTHDWNEEQDAGRSLQEATEMLVAQHPDWEPEIRAYYGRWEEMLGGPIQETVDILAHIKTAGQHRLYALTNWSAETFPIALKRFDFLHWFEGIVVSGTEKTRKPFPEFYQILLDRYKVTPGKAVFIDDNLRNVEAAKRLGIHSIHFKSPGQLAAALEPLGIVSPGEA
jgi:2-haloacid dehalogenase